MLKSVLKFMIADDVKSQSSENPLALLPLLLSLQRSSARHHAPGFRLLLIVSHVALLFCMLLMVSFFFVLGAWLVFVLA